MPRKAPPGPRKTAPAGGLLEARHSLLFVVDVQEKFVPVIANASQVISRIALLVEAARALAVPIALSEQYPKGLGPTVRSLADRLPNEAGRFEKTTFSAFKAPEGAAQFAAQRKRGRNTVVLCGIETHVCVLQTALDLAAHGYAPVLVADATGSHRDCDRDLGLARLRHFGIPVLSSEMVVFEWLERADRPEFKALQALLKNEAG